MPVKTPEGKVKDAIKKLCKKYRVYYTMPVTSGYSSSGVPDFLMCVSGRFLGVEAKAKRGVVSPLQAIRLQEIHEAGGVSAVVNESNLDALEYLLQTLTQRPGIRLSLFGTPALLAEWAEHSSRRKASD